MLNRNLIYLNNVVDKLNEEINVLKKSSEEDRADIKRTVDDISAHSGEWISQRLDRLEQAVDHNEEGLRCSNLKFGVVLEGGTYRYPTVGVIFDVLNQYSYRSNWSYRDISGAYRVGEWRGSADKPRPIVVQMHRGSDKGAIQQDHGMREALWEDNIKVAAELTTKQRQTIGFYGKQGRRAYYWKGKLQVEEKRSTFSWDSMQHQDMRNTSKSQGKDYPTKGRLRGTTSKKEEERSPGLCLES
ncbi:hypothetical protein ACOMHN_045763 [Nucella lapillus]